MAGLEQTLLIKLMQFLTTVTRIAKRMFHLPWTQVLGFNAQYLVSVVQVHIPADDALQVIQKIARMEDVFAVA
jgi:hypothetical protein